ncbi:MAG: hydantoinase B/oxoprolinase family protein, partial [Acidimicrobiales bacterium]
MRNAGHTVFVKETSDFGAYLVSPGGEVFMTPDDMGIFITIGTPMSTAIEAIDSYAEGDICVTNDPETSGAMVTHLPDFFMWTPIFAPGHDGPLCFAFCFIHATDIGGLVPGSVSPVATDMFQEGFILPPSKLVAGGALNAELAAILRANTRVPNLNWGDFRAEISALELSRRRMSELISRYGTETMTEGIDGVLAYSERQARTIIDEIPDGTYSFADYLEADFVGPRAPIRIALDLVVEGSDMVLDFSRTDPQVPLALNLVTHGKAGHNMLVPCLVNYFRAKLPDITYNSGMMRPVEVVVPRGSLLNPEPRAPVGARQATMFRVPDVIMGALSQAVPDEIPACGGGQGAVMLVAAPEFDTGATRVSILQPLIGGSGGGPAGDGIDGVDFVAGFYRNIPTEVLESDVPVLVEQYHLREGGGGPGRVRGGLGLSFAVRVLAPRATLTCRGMERTRFQPWGRSGGQPGSCGRAILRTADGPVRELGKIDVLEVGPGDVLELLTPCGAGFGDPLERPVDAVVGDVA